MEYDAITMDKTRALVDWAISVSIRLLAIEHTLMHNGALPEESLDLATQAVEEKLALEMMAQKSFGSTNLQTKISRVDSSYGAATARIAAPTRSVA
jgi:hypothetical protein